MYALQSEPESSKRMWVLLLGGLFGGAAFGVTLVFAAQVPSPERKPQNTVIQMVVVQSPKPEPSPLPPPEAPKSDPPKADPTPKKTARQKPDVAPPPAAEPQTPQEPLALGLTLSSTAQGAGGPKFATGDSLMGEPDRVAQAPWAPRAGMRDVAPRRVEASSSSPSSKNSVSVAAKLKRSTTPIYPAIARNQGVEGVVVLAITIGPDGRVEDAHVVKGLGLGLDESALAAARKTVWSPATVNGNPTRTTRRINVRFTLQS